MLNGFMPFITWGLRKNLNEDPADILKGIPIDWYHFRPLLNLVGQSLYRIGVFWRQRSTGS
jgi:hypothetical protein